MGGANVAYDGTMGDLFDGGHTFGDFNMFSNEFTAVNAGAPGTVSPKDLMTVSVPPSTTFTNMTTPGSSYLETPDDSYEASPLYNDNLADFNFAESNFFPDLDQLVPMNRTASSSSGNQITIHPGGPAVGRKRSVVPGSPAVRLSSIAGVSARKRDKPLPPIKVDENDPVALKRARNTAAARKSRARKVNEREDLETRIHELEQQLKASEEARIALQTERDFYMAKADTS